jgi:hypothetical protein
VIFSDSLIQVKIEVSSISIQMNSLEIGLTKQNLSCWMEKMIHTELLTEKPLLH